MIVNPMPVCPKKPVLMPIPSCREDVPTRPSVLPSAADQSKDDNIPRCYSSHVRGLLPFPEESGWPDSRASGSSDLPSSKPNTLLSYDPAALISPSRFHHVTLPVARARPASGSPFGSFVPGSGWFWCRRYAVSSARPFPSASCPCPCSCLGSCGGDSPLFLEIQCSLPMGHRPCLLVPVAYALDPPLGGETMPRVSPRLRC